MRRVEVIEADIEARIVALMLFIHTGNQRLGGNPLALGAQHDGGAMRIVSADIDAVFTLQLLEAHPDVGLHGFENVSEVDRAVGVRQRRGHENAARRGVYHLCKSLKNSSVGASLARVFLRVGGILKNIAGGAPPPRGLYFYHLEVFLADATI